MPGEPVIIPRMRTSTTVGTLQSSFVATQPQLSLKQRREWVEILIDFETRNQ